MPDIKTDGYRAWCGCVQVPHHRLADGHAIDAVGAWPHTPPTPTRSKRKVLSEGIENLCVVFALNQCRESLVSPSCNPGRQPGECFLFPVMGGPQTANSPVDLVVQRETS